MGFGPIRAGCRILENQTEKKPANEMETEMIQDLVFRT